MSVSMSVSMSGKLPTELVSPRVYHGRSGCSLSVYLRVDEIVVAVHYRGVTTFTVIWRHRMKSVLPSMTVFLAIVLSTTITPANAQEGVVSVQSPHDVATTIDKLAAALESKGMSIFGRVNHAQNAQKADLELRSTELLIFGNPKIGTPLMNCAQSVALDLPQKMLAWEDEAGNVYLGWNDPMHLKARHGIDGCDEVLETVSGALANFAKAATAP